MVATLCPLDLRSTHWAKDYAIDTFTPVEVLLQGVLTTCEIAVPVFSASKANGVGALRT
jgi:hypothetical protein